MTPTARTPEQARKDVPQQALTLLTQHTATIYANGDPLENAVRILNRRRMLTTDELRDAEIAQDRSTHRVYNHVPVARFNDEQKRNAAYIDALERATTVLLAQLDTVTDLAAVKKTVKGRQATEQAERARTFLEKAKARHRDSERHSTSYDTNPET